MFQHFLQIGLIAQNWSRTLSSSLPRHPGFRRQSASQHRAQGLPSVLRSSWTPPSPPSAAALCPDHCDYIQMVRTMHRLKIQTVQTQAAIACICSTGNDRARSHCCREPQHLVVLARRGREDDSRCLGLIHVAGDEPDQQRPTIAVQCPKGARRQDADCRVCMLRCTEGARDSNASMRPQVRHCAKHRTNLSEYIEDGIASWATGSIGTWPKHCGCKNSRSVARSR
eukprot:SAG11_NODE_1911_length_4079_cov_1.842462_3_plen_226_part_00